MFVSKTKAWSIGAEAVESTEWLALRPRASDGKGGLQLLVFS